MMVTNVFQERIAKAHGSQCGFCTPGIVMSMYALLRNNPTPQMAEVEEAFHGTPRQWHLRISVSNDTLQQKAMLCFYFPFQETCVVAPATDPSWRGSRLSLWSVNSHNNWAVWCWTGSFVSEMCKIKDKPHMQFTPLSSCRRAAAVGAAAWATAAVWLMATETETRRARLMYVHFFTTCFLSRFIIFTTIWSLWFSGSHIFIQRGWICTSWPHAGSHFPPRTNGKQQIPLSIETLPRSSPKMLKHRPVFWFNTVV